MAITSDSVIDVDGLLKPISDGNPCGEDLRSDPALQSVYYAVKEARQSARNEERTNVLEDDASTSSSEWSKVAEAAPEILAKQSKDLEILAWYTEALVRAHGFAGLRDAFLLTKGVVQQFWDDLYPRPDEDGLSTRVAPLTGLNGDDADGTLLVPINKVYLSDGKDIGPFASWHYRQACELDQMQDADKKAQRAAGGAATLELLQSAGTGTALEFFLNTRSELDQCIQAFSELCQSFEDKCGVDAPPSSNIRNALLGCSDALSFISGGRDVPAGEVAIDDVAGDPGDASDSVSRSTSGTASAVGEIHSREDAFRALLRVAAYFRNAEPHSPLSYVLEQSVRWGRMPLPELLTELIADDGARSGLFKLTGIRPGSDSDGSG